MFHQYVGHIYNTGDQFVMGLHFNMFTFWGIH